MNFEMERGEEDEEGDVMIEEEDGDTEEILARMLEIRERCHSKAKENIAAAQDKQKKQYDAKHNSLKVSLRWYYPNPSYVLPFVMYYMIRMYSHFLVKVYPVGSSVMLKNMVHSHRMGGKMDSVFKGPYTVEEIVGKGRYQLKSKDGKVLKKLYNGVLLKEYYSPGK